jgi:hypothetical protein
MDAFDIDYGLPKACKQCRQSKAKCQDEKPCQTCVEGGYECEFFTNQK